FSFDPEDLGFLQKVQDLGALSIFIGFIVGIFITALMHSSSAFSAIVITMAYNNIITWEVAAAMTLGSNVGSTIDAVLASVGTNADARRSAFIHVFFNVAGTVLALILFNPLLAFVSFLSGSMNIAIRISILHTVFKIVTTLCCLPFVPQIVRLSQIVIKDDTTPALKYYRLDFQENQIGKESVAMYIIRVEKEIADMTDVVTQMFNRLQQGFTKRNTSFVDENFEELELAENYCDQMHEQLVRYIIQCQQLPINNNQRNNLSVMIQVTDELEGMSDDCFSVGVLLKRSVEKKMKFLQEDMDRLIPYVELARQFLQFIRRNINKHLDKNKLEMASDLENQIDSFRKDLKKVARKRLESGADVKAELLYLDLVRQIEKIGDHAFSISELLVQTV
ncbi:MAG: Na/Pi symporter, partial [Treponemataceae bacterium]|nr:Na/Pi symporter [Treponemataceae bacterium]